MNLYIALAYPALTITELRSGGRKEQNQIDFLPFLRFVRLSQSQRELRNGPAFGRITKQKKDSS